MAAVRRLVGFNLLAAIVLGIAGFFLGAWIGREIGSGLAYLNGSDQNDLAVFTGFLFGTLGWLAGLGFLNYPLSRLAGRPARYPAEAASGAGRFFRLSTDHKVIGIQYFFGVGAFFLIGGINAMLIRIELLTPNEKAFPAGQYLSLVGLHGTMMIMMTSAFILGPFGNYFVPLMIGARRMAFPRIEALTFWLTPLSGLVLMSAIAWNGFPTGWTGYAPLASQARAGMDAYVWAFLLIGISLTLIGLNLMATILTMRAPGLTWTRLPIFVWGVFSTSILMVLAAPVLIATLLFVMLDRAANTSFYLASQGGSPYLYENLFWFFGHPEVYILALPGFGIVLEILPVFARKPLWGYRLAVAGMLGVAFLSFIVWQHHLFVSGINVAAAVLHADDRVDLGADRHHLSDRDGLDVARAHALQGADAVLGRLLLQLPDRRALRRLPLRRAERRHDARLVLHEAHFHYTIMGGGLRAHGGDRVLPAEDDRVRHG